MAGDRGGAPKRKAPRSGIREALGSMVRQLRRARGLSQETLAERSNLSSDSIRRIERGMFSPSLDTLAKLSAGLELELSTLFAAMEDRQRRIPSELYDALCLLSERERESLLRVINVLRFAAERPTDDE